LSITIFSLTGRLTFLSKSNDSVRSRFVAGGIIP
jgi:hypothetical protein